MYIEMNPEQKSPKTRINHFCMADICPELKTLTTFLDYIKKDGQRIDNHEAMTNLTMVIDRLTTFLIPLIGVCCWFWHVDGT